MSAVPVNDDERPLGIAAFSAVRAMGSMSASDLHILLGHIAGHLVDRGGVIGLTSAMSNIITAARRLGEPMTLAEVAWHVAAKHGVGVDDLRAPNGTPGCREVEIAHPRQEAFWLAWGQRRSDGTRRFTLYAIGKFFGGRDHSTIIEGIRAHSLRLLREPIA